MKPKLLLAILLVVSFLTACAQTTTPGAYPSPSSITPVPSNTSTSPAPTSKPTEAGPTAQPTAGMTPAQAAAVDAVSKKYNIPTDQIHIVSTEAVTWPNGCLGVVIPGVMCTDIVIDGYRIKLEADGQQFEIHTNLDGTIVVDAAQQLATLQFVVRTSPTSVQVVNPNIPLGPTYNPAFNGLLPIGGSILGTAYVLDFTKAIAVSPNEQHDLSFIQNPTLGLAIWRGGLGTQSLLAWGTLPNNSDRTSSLIVSQIDGSNLETLLTTEAGSTNPVQLVAELWSADGQSLYFSKEPVGLGGYIPFAGASNLYKVDIKTKQVTEIIPQTSSPGAQTCLDAISGDYRFVADHCTQNVITVRDLQSGSTATIQVQAGFTDYRLIGSARFSPTGNRVAFALAKGNPDNEQGRIAVGDSSGGSSKLILTGDPGGYYTILGWLDDQTLLVQFNSINNPNANSQVLTLSVDGSVINKVADGSLLTIIDNR